VAAQIRHYGKTVSYEYRVNIELNHQYSGKYRPKPIEFQELSIITAPTIIVVHNGTSSS